MGPTLNDCENIVMFTQSYSQVSAAAPSFFANYYTPKNPLVLPKLPIKPNE